MYKVREVTLPARRVGCGKPISGSADVHKLLQDMGELGVETMQVVIFDTKNKLVDRQLVHMGTVDECTLSMACLFRPVIASGCLRCIFAHNHPSGDPQPSGADLIVTKMMKDAASLLDLTLLDHVIIAGDKYWSAAGRGHL